MNLEECYKELTTPYDPCPSIQSVPAAVCAMLMLSDEISTSCHKGAGIKRFCCIGGKDGQLIGQRLLASVMTGLEVKKAVLADAHSRSATG